MKAIICESLIYSVSKVLQTDSELTYYQYRDLSSFVELVSLHDEIFLLLGETHAQEFYDSYAWLISYLESEANLNVKNIDASNRNEYLRSEVASRFNEVLRRVYDHDLGITIDELLKKSEVDRSFKEDITPFENVFKNTFSQKKFDRFAQFIFESWDSNQYLPLIRYLFRGHLLKAMSDIHGLTPFYENSRILIQLLQNMLLTSTRIGTLPYTVFQTVNTVFVNSLSKIPASSNYPQLSVLMRYIVSQAKTRQEILEEITKLRKSFDIFRKEYSSIENRISDLDESLATRSKSMQKLEESLQKILVPTVISFGKSYPSNTFNQFVNSLFGKYGIGDVKLKLNIEESASVDDSVDYSSPSLTKLGIDSIRSLYEVHKDSELLKLNKPLLEVTKAVIESEEVLSKANQIMPVKNYSNKINSLIDENIYRISPEIKLSR